MTLTLPSRLTRQPQQSLPIARNNPLAAGLVAAYYPQGTNAIAQGSPRFLAGAAGLGFASTSNSRWQVSPNAKVSLSPTWTILTILQGTESNTSGGGTALYTERPNANQIVKLAIGDGTTNFATLVVRDASGSNLVLFRGVTDVRTMATPRVIAGVRRSASSHALYVNGRLDSSSTASAAGTFNDTAAQIGGDAQDVNSALTGTASVPLVLLWTRALSDAEIAAVSANPWQVLAPRQRSMVALASAAPVGNTYTLTADQGAYALTGNAAGLRIARKVTANAGAYALTGNPATLRVARRMPVTAGSYAITGVSANLIKGTAPKALQVESGTYSITGKAVTLKVSRRMTAAPGSYALTGFATGAPRDYSGFRATVQYHYIPRSKLTLVRFA